MNDLIKKIESYGFECEAGELKDCQDWIDLKKKINDLIDRIPNNPVCSD